MGRSLSIYFAGTAATGDGLNSRIGSALNVEDTIRQPYWGSDYVQVHKVWEAPEEYAKTGAVQKLPLRNRQKT